MDDFGVVLLWMVAIGAGLVAVIALVRAGQAQSQATSLTARVLQLSDELRALRRQGERRDEAPILSAPILSAPLAAEAVAPEPILEAKPIEAPVVAAPVPPPAAVMPEKPSPAPTQTLEEKIAFWLTRIGALALLVGIGFFFKYAVDNDWIGPLGRVAMGVGLGVGLLGFGEWTRPRTQPRYVWILLGVGLAALYLSTFASLALYHLFPPTPVFLAVTVISLLGGALSIRHRAEPILVLALLGALMAPVLLSTGQDNPLGLFGYLLVVTSLTLVASVRMRFQYVHALAMAGTVLLFYGWWDRFFDAHDAYASLGDRAVPLLALTLFFGQWLTVALRTKGFAGSLFGRSLSLAPLALAPLGFGVLLSDKPLLLAGVLVVHAAVSVGVLQLLDGQRLLGVPLTSSFLVLATVAQHVPDAARGGLLGLLGLLTLGYGTALVRQRKPGPEKTDVKMELLLGAVGVGCALVGMFVLGDSHPLELMALFGVLSLGYVLLSLGSTPRTALAALLMTFFGLVFCSFQSEKPVTWKFIALLAVWAGFYLGGAAWELVRRKTVPTVARLATMSGAGIGFLVLSVPRLPGHDWIASAALLASVGAVDLALGLLVLRRSERRRATVLLGQALGLFAAAFACLFSGAAITVVWAVLAAVVVFLAAEEKEPWWLFGGLLLFVACAVRVFGVDMEAAQAPRLAYLASNGAYGKFELSFLLNVRTVAFLGTAVAMLVSGGLAARRGAKPRVAVGLLVTGAHVLLLVWAVLEAHALALTLPPKPTAGATTAEVQQFAMAYWTAIQAQAGKLSMVTTLMLSGYATVLVVLGFVLREQLHRYLGLILFGVGLSKLVLWDVWQLTRVYQMLILVFVGALLLGASFLYARFGRRLVGLVKEGSLKTLLLLGILSLLSVSSVARADPLGDFPLRRELGGVQAAGLYRVEVDPLLYEKEGANPVVLRVVDGQGQEVASLLRPARDAVVPELRGSRLVDPVTLPRGGARAVLDLGATGLKHDEVLLQVSGQDFIRSAKVESSTDEVSFATLAEDLRVYRVRSGSSEAESLTLRYPVSDARYLRVTIDAGADGHPLQIVDATVHWEPPALHGVTQRTLGLRSEAPLGAEEARESHLGFLSPPPSLPVTALNLVIEGAEFERAVRVGASTDGQYWEALGGGVIFRAGKEATLNTEALSVPVRATRARHLRVEISNGDDKALRVTAASVTYAPDELVFRASGTGPYYALLGNPAATSGSFDLPAVLAREGSVTLANASWGDFSANPRANGPRSAGPAPWTERQGLLLSIVLGAVLLALAAWTFRLMRKA